MATPQALLTSICVIAIAAFGISKGVDLVRFEAVEGDIEAFLQQPTPDSAALKKHRAATLHEFSLLDPWTSKLGLSSRALQMKAFLAGVAESDAAEEAAVVDLLAVEPTAGAVWLDLALLRRRRDAPTPQIVSALEMSELTHPRELETVIPRTLYEMQLWESLSSDQHRRALNRLLELKGKLNTQQLEEFKSMIEAKPSSFKDVVARELIARGAVDRNWLRALGLQP